MGERGFAGRRIGFLHTTPSTIGMAAAFLEAALPGAVPVHFYDGAVKLDNFASPVGVTPKANLLRWAEYAARLERAGCEAIVSCCSLMPRATEYARSAVSVPLIQLDDYILDEAVRRFHTIGVITTTPYTRPYVEERLRFKASALGKTVELSFGGDPEALELFNRGRYAEHDALVLADAAALASGGVECVVFGQIPFGLMDRAIKERAWPVPTLYVDADSLARVGEELKP